MPRREVRLHACAAGTRCAAALRVAATQILPPVPDFDAPGAR